MKIKWLAIAFSIFVGFVIVFANLGLLPNSIRAIYNFPYGDKLGHLVLFGILNFLVTISFLRKFTSAKPIKITILIGFALALLIGVEEYSQQYFPKRTFDLIDLLFSYLGLSIGAWIALIKK